MTRLSSREKAIFAASIDQHDELGGVKESSRRFSRPKK